MRPYSKKWKPLFLAVAFLTTFVAHTNAAATKSLINAVINGDIAYVQRALEDSKNVDIVDDYGRTLLSLSLMSEHPELALFLIKRGANVDAVDVGGKTVLNFAVESGFLDVVKDLLDRVVNINDGSIIIAMSEVQSYQLAKLLIDKGVDINYKTKRGKTALMIASSESNLDTVKLLIDSGADLNLVSDGGGSALTYAAQKGNLEIAKLLLRRGANVNPEQEENNSLLATPLMWAAINGHVDIVKLLIKNGADINAKNKDGETAISLAEELLRRSTKEGAIKKYGEQNVMWTKPEKLEEIIGILNKGGQ